MKTPVVFIIFNRPDTTQRVFEEIRKARPPLLFLVADGPRPGHSSDVEQCIKARAVVEQVDWDCEVRKNFSDINLGCRNRVSSGLDWVFSQVEEVIVLEDDCLPHPTFFQFCEELLRKYRDNDQIGQIGGVNFQFGRKRESSSYYFSRYIHIWGWASWRRAWRGYDSNLLLWPKLKKERWLRKYLGNRPVVGYWTNVFERVHQEQIDTWDYQWVFHCWTRNLLAIIPNVNLISNIGFDTNATHTMGQSNFSNMKTEALSFPLDHPPLIMRNSSADEYTEKYHYFIRSFTYHLLHRVMRSFHGM